MLHAVPRVRFTRHLARFFPALDSALGPIEIAAADVRGVLSELELRFPGLRHYLCDERGALRKHVNVFVDGEAVGDRAGLSDPVAAASEIHILQALSGG